MEIETLMQPENLVLSCTCANFAIIGQYKVKKHYILFVMRYEIAKKQWSIDNIRFSSELKGNYMKNQELFERELFEQLIYQHSEAALKEVEELLFSLRKVTFSRNYHIEYEDDENKTIHLKDEKTGKVKIFMTLNKDNVFFNVQLHTRLNKRREFNFTGESIEWLENLEEFRTFLLTESKERIRLLMY